MQFEKNAENDNYEVICTDELIVDTIRSKKKIWHYGPFTNDFYKHLLEKGNCVSTSASIVKKEFLLKQNIFFNEESNFIIAEDYDFFMNIAFNNIMGFQIIYKDRFIDFKPFYYFHPRATF